MTSIYFVDRKDLFFFFIWKRTSIIYAVEVNLNFLVNININFIHMKDELTILENGRWPKRIINAM